MDHTMVLSYDYSNRNRRRQRTNAPPSRAIRWPWQWAGAIWSASPNAAWPGLHRKPLDAAIGLLLAPYYPMGRQGGNQLNDDATCTHFVGRFDGHCNAAVLYCKHPLNAAIGQALAPIGIKRTCLPLFQGYISSSSCWKRAQVALITIGVWHIKLMRST